MPCKIRIFVTKKEKIGQKTNCTTSEPLKYVERNRKDNRNVD